MLTLCTMGVWAQEGIKVEFQGASPNIFDFAWSYFLNYDPNTEDYEATTGIRDALERYLQNENQDDNVTLIVDKKAGFISYEHLHQGHAQLIELCFWNEADKKHKLFAYSNWSYFNGHPELGQFDALAFYRYDNATAIGVTSMAIPNWGNSTRSPSTAMITPRVRWSTPSHRAST